MDAKYGADVGLFFGAEVFFVVCVGQDGEEETFNAERRLDDIRYVALVGFGIKIVKCFAAGLDVLCEVVVGSVGNAPELAPSEREQEFEVCGCLGIEAKLLGIVVTQAEIFFFYAEREQPVLAEAAPVVKPFKVGAGLAEEFKLHLLELTHTEYEVAGSDLVTEGFTDLCDTEGNLFAGCTLDVCEVYENALRRFGSEVYFALAVFGYALKGLEHQVTDGYR